MGTPSERVQKWAKKERERLMKEGGGKSSFTAWRQTPKSKAVDEKKYKKKSKAWLADKAKRKTDNTVQKQAQRETDSTVQKQIKSGFGDWSSSDNFGKKIKSDFAKKKKRILSGFDKNKREQESSFEKKKREMEASFEKKKIRLGG